MKKKTGVLIIVFLTGMILGTMLPAMVLAVEVPPGYENAWDPYVYPSPYTGTKVFGPLSIYYSNCGTGCYYMFYTLRLSKGNNLYLFQGKEELTNYTSLIDASAQKIIDILRNVVVPTIFKKGYKDWVIKSIDYGISYDEQTYPFTRAFVADITLAVKEK